MKKRKLLLPTALMLALIGCTDDDLKPDDNVRNTYDSLADCTRLYKEGDCTKEEDSWNNEDEEDTVRHTYYHGPWFPYYMYQRQMVYGGRDLGALGVQSQGRGFLASNRFYPKEAFSVMGNPTSSAGAKIAITPTARGGFGSIGRGASS